MRLRNGAALHDRVGRTNPTRFRQSDQRIVVHDRRRPARRSAQREGGACRAVAREASEGGPCPPKLAKRAKEGYSLPGRIGGWNARPVSQGKKIQVSCDTSVMKVSTSGRPIGLA